MRLCIHRFRHGRIIDIFSGVKIIDAVKDELIRAQTIELPAITTKEEQEKHLASLFQRIKDRYDLLPDYQSLQRRLHKPEVVLTGERITPYGPNSSLLNQLIVSQLALHGAFDYMPGKATVIGTFPEGNHVMKEVAFRGDKKQKFHRIIERHGTPFDKDIGLPGVLAHKCFEEFREGLKLLKERWDNPLFAAGDQTREPQWKDPAYFGTTPAAQIETRRRAFDANVRKVGVYVRSLSIVKQLDNTGGSTFNYQFDKLSVVSGKLLQMRLVFSSVAGIIGDLKLDGDADRLNISWLPDKRDPAVGSLKERLNCMRRLSGTLIFAAPITAKSAATFGFSFKIFNGDALSKWEFYQMYSPEDRSYINGKMLSNEIEYVARMIWFPVETLRLKVILPSCVSTPPFLIVHSYQDLEHIPREVILDDKDVLHIAPAAGSNFHPQPEDGPSSWLLVDDPWLTEGGLTTLANTASQAWELTVSKPRIGSSYSLAWVLDDPQFEFTDLERQAVIFRERLLRHRNQRHDGKPGLPAVTECFRVLQREVRDLFMPAPGEPCDISIMTYDKANRALVPIEGMIGDDDFSEELMDSAIPFGIGLAGSAFKEAEILFRVADPPVFLPFYISLPGRPTHQFLLSAPLDHPNLVLPGPAARKPIMDRSRQCLGVLNVGSFSPASKMRMVPELVDGLTAVCRRFSERLYDILKDA